MNNGGALVAEGLRNALMPRGRRERQNKQTPQDLQKDRERERETNRPRDGVAAFTFHASTQVPQKHSIKKEDRETPKISQMSS